MTRTRRLGLSAIDLCSGAGGVTAGFKAAGINVVAALDICPKARATYAANHPDVRLLEDDLLQLSPSDLLTRLELSPGGLSILTACVPCQTFSTLGRQHRRKTDPRNRLVARIAEFAAELEPKAVVLENVPPLQNDLRFRRLVGRLRRLGYGVSHDVVDAADFGIPQRRRRLVMIAIRGRRDEEVPRLSAEHPSLSKFAKRTTVGEVLAFVAKNASGDPLAQPRRNYPKLVAERIAAIPKDGGSRSSLPLDLTLKCHRKSRRSAAGNIYGRMRLDDVAPTLTTRCTTPSCGRYLHPIEDRAVTLREAAALQTFPIDYSFKGGTISIESQIGNAVPPRLAEAIGVLLGEELG